MNDLTFANHHSEGNWQVALFSNVDYGFLKKCSKYIIQHEFWALRGSNKHFNQGCFLKSLKILRFYSTSREKS